MTVAGNGVTITYLPDGQVSLLYVIRVTVPPEKLQQGFEEIERNVHKLSKYLQFLEVGEPS